MRTCVFSSLSLLSVPERSARRINFDRQMTVLYGPNQTGKSCILKTIYRTLGAIPPKMHREWEAANVHSLLRFSLDGADYAMLRSRGRYTLFDGERKPVRTFRNVREELAPFFAELFNFRLHLQSRDDGSPQATPAFLLLPFYVDQDTGWQDNWSSFEQLHQFSRWRRDVAEYHMGMRPNQYYVLRTKLARAQGEVEAVRRRREVFENVLAELEQGFPSIDLHLDMGKYRSQIEELLARCNDLKERETALKRRLAQVHNARITLQTQIRIAESAVQELSADYHFAAEDLQDEEIECPTCGTVHANSFAERFAIARDEGRCREVLVELRAELDEKEAELRRIQEQYAVIAAELAKVTEVLNRRQGDVSLRDIIEAQGGRQAQGIIEASIAKIRDQDRELTKEAQLLEQEMRGHTSKDQRRRVEDFYTRRMKRYLMELDVRGLHEEGLRRLHTSIDLSGSVLPRALLAYYFAVLHSISRWSPSTFFPIVIDSPHQQDQDKRNWSRILTFIRDNQPEGSQVILALVDDAEVKLPGARVELRQSRSALLEEEYTSVFADMAPLVDAAYWMR